jgi:hypothetical protein
VASGPVSLRRCRSDATSVPGMTGCTRGPSGEVAVTLGVGEGQELRQFPVRLEDVCGEDDQACRIVKVSPEPAELANSGGWERSPLAGLGRRRRFPRSSRPLRALTIRLSERGLSVYPGSRLLPRGPSGRLEI